MYSIYDAHLNKNTKNYGGIEWVIDGENGRWTYPGTCSREYCKRLYSEGKSWESVHVDYKKDMQEGKEKNVL